MKLIGIDSRIIIVGSILECLCYTVLPDAITSEVTEKIGNGIYIFELSQELTECLELIVM